MAQSNINKSSHCEEFGLQKDEAIQKSKDSWIATLISFARKDVRKKRFSSRFTLYSSPRTAFTLAEVLITLGVIGVVAAMTIPTLMKNIGDAQYKAAWKKGFSTLNQAYNYMVQDNGGSLSGYIDRPTGIYHPDPFIANFVKHLSVAKDCASTSATSVNFICGTSQPLTNAYKCLSGNYLDPNEMNYGNIVLNDGSQLFFRTYQTGHFLIWVDVNGYNKQPNTLGKDLFGIEILKDKIIPMGATGSGTENTCKTNAVYPGGTYGYHNGVDVSGAGCSAEFLIGN